MIIMIINARGIPSQYIKCYDVYATTKSDMIKFKKFKFREAKSKYIKGTLIDIIIASFSRLFNHNIALLILHFTYVLARQYCEATYSRTVVNVTGSRRSGGGKAILSHNQAALETLIIL